MGIMLAGIELVAASAFRVHEGRHIVYHPIPGFDGGALQDLGRGPAVFAIEGVLHGDRAKREAAELDLRFREGEPVELVAALATVFEAHRVLIRTLQLTEQAGWANIVRIHATVLEYVEPPTVQAFRAGPADGALADLGELDPGGIPRGIPRGIEEAAESWRSAMGERMRHILEEGPDAGGGS